MKKILITGGTGLVGTALTEKLLEKGYEVNWLSRSKTSNSKVNTYIWNLDDNYIDMKTFENVHHIIHLAGANIAAKRWTKSYKNTIRKSRIDTSQLLFDYVKKHTPPLETFISASAVGYYGTFTSKETLTEDSPEGKDFLANVCIDWENKAKQFENLGIRTVIIRTGVVISEKGGALPQLQKPIKWGLGAPLSNGKQYMPWIHLDDLVNTYVKAIEDSNMSGSYNGTAPEAITNKELTAQLAKHFNKPLWIPCVPKSILKLLLGERATILLKGTHIIPQRLLLQEDFSFQYPTFERIVKTL